MGDILGAISSSIELAKELYELIDSFREAPSNARAHLLDSQLGNIRLDLLRTALERTKSLDPVQRRRVKAAVGGLNKDLRDAIMYLQDSAPDNLVSRMRWAVWTGKGVTKLFDDIESRFSILLSLVNLAQHSPSLQSLDKDHFTIISVEADYKYLPYVERARYCAEADWIAPDKSNLNQARPPINVLVESYRTTRERENESNKKQYQEARTVARFVAERLWWTRVSGDAAEVPYQTGVLPCIGFANSRVVFLLPSNAVLDKPQTLTESIMANTGVSLETRFALALQLAEAVFKLHLAGLAHRSIRSNLILFLRPKQESNADGTAAARNGAKEDAATRTRHSQDPGENPQPGILKRVTQHLAGKKVGIPALEVPSKALRRTTSSTSMRNDKPNLFKRIVGLGEGASNGRDLDLLGKAAADQDQGATPSSLSYRTPSNSTPRCGKIPPGFGSLYLTGWTSAHHTGYNHSPRMPERARDIYRHPALRKTTAFYMSYDIYSLGVCLVEVGMWDLFVHKEASNPQATTKYGKLASRADVQSSGVDLETVKNRIVGFASKELPATMGEGYATVVNTCLRCSDPDGPWKGVKSEDFCERFRDDVLLPLRSIVGGFSSRRLETTTLGR